MITPEFVREMAAYNTWQNRQLYGYIHAIDEERLRADRGAFFGSVLGTLNHLTWGDQMWMSRFGASAPPELDFDAALQMTRDAESWQAARQPLDAAIRDWAETVTVDWLAGELHFYSGVLRRDVSKPTAPCVVHFFNHQTHHRGQVHAMLTATGSEAPVSDLFLMPRE